MKKYTCLLFDLDHTLWDYEANAREALIELFQTYKLNDRGITSFNYFYETFIRINTELWDKYDRGYIGQDVIRQERFHMVFDATGLDNRKLSLEFSSDFLQLLPRKGKLMPYAKETLDYLSKQYPLVIITNGFEETQSAKLTSSQIHHYFSHVITSQKAGHKKPSKEIFDFSLRTAGHAHPDCLMIGDNLQTDIAGARGAGIDTVYFNPDGKGHDEVVTFEIRELNELRTML